VPAGLVLRPDGRFRVFSPLLRVEGLWPGRARSRKVFSHNKLCLGRGPALSVTQSEGVFDFGFGCRRKFFGSNELQETSEFSFAGTPVNNCQFGQFGFPKSFAHKGF